MGNILVKAGLLLLGSTIIVSCGGGASFQAEIIDTLNKEAAFQASQPAPVLNPADAGKNIEVIMTSIG